MTATMTTHHASSSRWADLDRTADPAAVFTDYAVADRIFHLGQGLERARANGAVTAAVADAWIRSLHEAMAANRFCCAVTGFIAAGRRG